MLAENGRMLLVSVGPVYSSPLLTDAKVKPGSIQSS